jgi:hypothetical protein
VCVPQDIKKLVQHLKISKHPIAKAVVVSLKEHDTKLADADKSLQQLEMEDKYGKSSDKLCESAEKLIIAAQKDIKLGKSIK